MHVAWISSLSRREGVKLARRTNYGFGKRQKELKRAQKRQQKIDEKRARKAVGADGAAAPGEAVESVEPADGDKTGVPPAEPEPGADP
jgi:hypothetical protein